MKRTARNTLRIVRTSHFQRKIREYWDVSELTRSLSRLPIDCEIGQNLGHGL